MATTHGERGHRTKEYVAWDHMKGRCLRPNNANYHRYGGRGIRVCKRWLVYENFLADMGLAPTPKHSLDRIKNNGNYTPKNCRWSTKTEQLNNTRRNRIVVYNGKKWTLAYLVKFYSLNYQTTRERLRRGWTIKDAVTVPKITQFANKRAVQPGK